MSTHRRARPAGEPHHIERVVGKARRHQRSRWTLIRKRSRSWHGVLLQRALQASLSSRAQHRAEPLGLFAEAHRRPSAAGSLRAVFSLRTSTHAIAHVGPALTARDAVDSRLVLAFRSAATRRTLAGVPWSTACCMSWRCRRPAARTRVGAACAAWAETSNCCCGDIGGPIGCAPTIPIVAATNISVAVR